MSRTETVWIVDDDRSIRWVLEKALARENLATRSFSNAREAMEALKTSTPQVLVSDIRMPGESGLDLLQTVKTAHPGLPVIIITARSALDDRLAGLDGGASFMQSLMFQVNQQKYFASTDGSYIDQDIHRLWSPMTATACRSSPFCLAARAMPSAAEMLVEECAVPNVSYSLSAR